MFLVYGVHPIYREEDFWSTGEIVRNINDSLKVKRGETNTDRDKIIFGVVAIDRLRAMGVHLEETSRLFINPGKWDKKTHTYPKIQRAIDKRREKLGLSDDDLENLVIANRLERDIQRLQARKIAREEIGKAFSNSLAADN